MSSPWLRQAPTAAHRAAFADSELRSYWNDTVPAREPHPPLEAAVDCDLCVVGGGYTGLWAALYAKELDPERSVVLLEGARCGSGASSRNGGFLNYSLTHGLGNGLARFPREIDQIERLGMANFSALADDLHRYGIEAEYEATGEIDVAVTTKQALALQEAADELVRHGHVAELLDRERVVAEVSSPLYLAGLWQRSGAALVNPARLADGLRAAAIRLGVQIYEDSHVRRLLVDHGRRGRAGQHVTAVTESGEVRARRLLLATSAHAPLVDGIRRMVAPVYDYVLMTEPLTGSQLQSVGWRNRQGLADTGNQFHYYRLSADNRILWGGYDAVYRYGGPVRPALDDDPATFARLASNFYTTFPQLEGVRFSHRWGGAIDTCSRFSVFFGRALGGRVVYAVGYTGLGVGASRFGGRTALDLLDGRRSEATDLTLVRRRPTPFPPEPLRTAVIQLTRNRISAADRTGRRGLWLRALDRAGLGFDS